MSELINIYREVKPKYEKLRANICSVLEQKLEEKNIPIFSIESRIKDENSYLNKVSRKGYSEPIEQIEDVCGVRVICYYQEDIEKICSIVKGEFCVISEENKQEMLNHDQFGYSSYHYIVKLKDSWLGHPSARGLGDFKAEVQIRTMLMHTWSAISHKLLYKSELDVEPQFKRKLNRLSALIELADEQFNLIKNEKIKFQNKMPSSIEEFDTTIELSSDSLVALHEHYFSDRKINEDDVPNLVEEVRSCGYTLKDLIEAIEQCLPILDEMERYEFSNEEVELPHWAFSGVIRNVLDLTCDQYFLSREDIFPSNVKDAKDKYRAVLKKI
ncbi:(p)ppGpp synthetase [Vibrio antiquarius]